MIKFTSYVISFLQNLHTLGVCHYFIVDNIDLFFTMCLPKCVNFLLEINIYCIIKYTNKR